MARMSAELMVRLLDGFSGPAGRVRAGLTALQKAERDVTLARTGQRLTRMQIAEERVLAAQEAEREKRQARFAAYGRTAGMGIAAGGYIAARAWRSYAELERTIGRIVINADKPAEAIRPTIAVLEQVADAAKLPFNEVVSGLEALVASGRTLEESLAFLPAIAATAQASGSALSDIALSADAMSNAMGITAGEMQRAFDILVAGGKAGKFELKDMAPELPSLLPAFAALGYKGEAGLKKIVAMLQVVRNQTGSSSEAATNLANVFQKAYSNEVANNFKKFGIDIRKELDKTRKSGGDMIDTLLQMSNKALKGDLSRLPLLFSDAQMQAGIRSLITQIPELKKQFDDLGLAAGSVERDLKQITSDSEGEWQTLVNNIGKVGKALGDLTGKVANPLLDGFNAQLSDSMALLEGGKRLRDSGRDEGSYIKEFQRQYRKQNPDAWFWEVNEATNEAFRKLGRGQIKNLFDALDADMPASRGGPLSRVGKKPHSRTGLPDVGPVPARDPRTMTVEERITEGYARSRNRAYAAGVSEEEAARRRAAMSQDELRARMESFVPAGRDFTVDATEAGSQIADGVKAGGTQAAADLADGISRGATEAARILVSAIKAALASATVKVDARVPATQTTTGQRLQLQSDGQFIDR